MSEDKTRTSDKKATINFSNEEIERLKGLFKNDIGSKIMMAVHERHEEMIRLNAWADVISNLEKVKNSFIGKDKEFDELKDLFDFFIRGVERTKLLSIFKKH